MFISDFRMSFSVVSFSVDFVSFSGGVVSFSVITTMSTKKTSIMLQTARGEVADVQEQSNVAINIVFDSCSQRTYVTERIAKILSLEPTSRQNVTIKTFGHNEKELDVGEYEFCLKTNDNQMNVYVRALGVPNICSSIYGQRIDIAKTEHPFLNDLVLANDRNNLEEDIDLLIGADLYWTLVEDKIKRDDNSGPVSIKSNG